ncbi:hypothetical protein JQM69_11065 [Faecalicatena contorta]|uniref:hypothetical protein n=1 Tax=Faecalicatena contorta TaxID=39482 RepID=UPI001F35F6C1|nr:hypothetical protein [Faecalicatena contorta]MCF2681213.1 hypothetical protein [Faecalicatena contorta]
MTNNQAEYELQNREAKDNGAKLVFDDPILCAQFLRGYLGIEILKDVKPEDIEDISERFLPMWQEGRDSDTVKKVHLKEQDLKNLKEVPKQYFEHLGEHTPEYLLKLISKIIAVLLYRMNVPRKEVEQFTDQIMGREFDMLFDSFEAYDVQETRRISREEGRMEGRLVGHLEERIQIICKKLKKNKSVSEIADALEEEQDIVQKICDIAFKYAPDYDIEKIMKELNEN